tara:strand:+ start:1313 stop:1939 length:627 start_codon:yes stop_codon:yes gene_type:complete
MVKRLGVKASQEWKQDIRHSGPYPSGRSYTDHIDGKARRLHESYFLVTLNTNQQMKSVDEEIGKKIVCDTLDKLKTSSSVSGYLKMGPKNSHYGRDLYRDVVQSYEFHGNAEIGEKLHRLHAHFRLKIHHYSQLQIDMPELTKQFKKAYTSACFRHSRKDLVYTGNTYCHVKLLPETRYEDAVRRYIDKGMGDACSVATIRNYEGPVV